MKIEPSLSLDSQHGFTFLVFMVSFVPEVASVIELYLCFFFPVRFRTEFNISVNQALNPEATKAHFQAFAMKQYFGSFLYFEITDDPEMQNEESHDSGRMWA